MRNYLISLALCSVTTGAAVLAACSAPDPGVGALGLSHTIGVGGSLPTVSQDAGATGSTPTPTGSTGEDAGAPASGGGVDAGGGGGDAAAAGGDGGATGEGVGFLGETTPWAANQPTATAQSQMGTTTTLTPTSSCMTATTCHGAGGAGGPFLAGGFVATAAGGTTGAADVEVRVYANGGGGGYSGYTDANGYFFITQPTGSLGPFNAGVRAGPAGTAPMTMPSPQGASTDATLDCESASCHGGATTGPIHI